MDTALKRFARLLYLEALVCLALGAGALIIPEALIRALFQVPGASDFIWADAVLLVRAVGWALIGLGVFHAAVGWSARGREPDLVTWCAASARVVLGGLRWCVLIQGPLPLVILGWLDLFLAVWTVYMLLFAHDARKARDEGRELKPWRFAAWISMGLIVALAGCGAIVGYQLWLHLFRVEPDRTSRTDEEHFKYGSFGNDRARGLPLYVFEALPDAFPDKLPGGWESLGFLFEPGRKVPVGFHLRTIGFPGITPNCALCHTGRYRAEPDAPVVLVPGAPAETFDFHGFLKFLFECGDDPRFTDGTLLEAIKKRHELGSFEEHLYAHGLLPALAAGLRLGGRDFEWMTRQPAAGPGRQDAGAMLKFNLLRLQYDGHVSTSEIRHLWNQQLGAATAHRWSGGGLELQQENTLAAALFLFFQPALFDAAGFGRMTNYLATLKAPPFPVPPDPAMADSGREIFDRECATCHGLGGFRTGSVTPLDELGTDPEYLEASTLEFLDALMGVDAPPFVFDRQQMTDGYLNSTLEGIWLRAPYLHNGSVPTLQDLLQPPGQRPVTFFRGGSRLDARKVGFVRDESSLVPSFLFDTRLRGNGNDGHSFGVDLEDTEKAALIEYLKTL